MAKKDAVTQNQPDGFKHVAVLIGSSGSYGRGLLRGVAKYNRERANWSTFFRPQTLIDQGPAWLKDWKGDGILAQVGTDAFADMLAKLGIPVVNLRFNENPGRLPHVGLNHVEVGVIAAQHLLSLGLKQFAFYGSAKGTHAGLDERAKAFAGEIEQAGFNCATFMPTSKSSHNDWEGGQARLAKWLQSLPKPIGLMASNDERGLRVLDACRRVGISVPDDIAVIGVDNDELLCELSIPPLTSVDVNGEYIGFEASAALDTLMSGQNLASHTTLLSPRTIVTRRSTDVIASEDAEVNRVVSFIRQHGGRPLSVVDVLRHVNMSRASLQQRMKRVLGHTIHEEIERVRLSRVKRLLVESDLTIKQLTVQTGFSSVQYMTRVFRAAVGETPAQYRRTRESKIAVDHRPETS